MFPKTGSSFQVKIASTNYVRGRIKWDSGDKPGAIADLDEAISFQPDYADAHYGRGEMKSKLGDKQGAIFDL